MSCHDLLRDGETDPEPLYILVDRIGRPLEGFSERPDLFGGDADPVIRDPYDEVARAEGPFEGRLAIRDFNSRRLLKQAIEQITVVTLIESQIPVPYLDSLFLSRLRIGNKRLYIDSTAALDEIERVVDQASQYDLYLRRIYESLFESRLVMYMYRYALSRSATVGIRRHY